MNAPMRPRRLSSFLDGMARTFSFGMLPSRPRLSVEERLAAALDSGYAKMAEDGWRSSWNRNAAAPRLVLRDNAILSNAEGNAVRVAGSNVIVRNCRIAGVR